MPRINTIPQDGNVDIQDRLLGVGSGGGGRTYTYTLASIADLLANHLEIDGHIQNIMFVGSYPVGTTPDPDPNTRNAEFVAGGTPAQEGAVDVYTISFRSPDPSNMDMLLDHSQSFYVRNGATGATGDTGMTGPQGETGPRGIQGLQGVGITDITAGAVDGTLNITFGTGGTVFVTPDFTGPQGPAGATGATGPQGQRGNGITSVVVSPAGADGTRNITINYTDIPSQTITDALRDGDSVTGVVFNNATNALTFSTRDGNSFTADITGFTDDFVATTGNQTIGGVKTFTDVVRAPSPVESSDTTDVATTEWVRDHLGSGGGGQDNQDITTTAPITGAATPTSGDVTIGIDQTQLRLAAEQLTSGTLPNTRLNVNVPTSVSITRGGMDQGDTATITNNELIIDLTEHSTAPSHDTPDPSPGVTPSFTQRQTAPGQTLTYTVSFTDTHNLFTYTITSISRVEGDTNFNIPAISGDPASVDITTTAPGTATFRAILTATHTDNITTPSSVEFTLTAREQLNTFRHGVLNLPRNPQAGDNYTGLDTSPFVNGSAFNFNRTAGGDQDYAVVVIPQSLILTTDFTVNTTRWEFVNRSGFAFAFERDATDSYIDGTDLVLWFELTVNERFILTDINI